MSADPVDPEILASQARNAPLTRPRPGHADLAGMQKYGHDDARPVLERASARETAARVALGTSRAGIPPSGSGHRAGQPRRRHRQGRSARWASCPPSSSVRSSTTTSSAASTRPQVRAMVDEIEAARGAGDTLGGIVEVVVFGLPPGLGSHVHWDRRIDAQLAGGPDGHTRRSRASRSVTDSTSRDAAGRRRTTRSCRLTTASGVPPGGRAAPKAA